MSESGHEVASATLRGSVSDDAVGFARAMVELDGSDFDVLYFMDRSEKWDGEYREWLRLGKPSDDGDERWDEFAEAVEKVRA